MEAILALQKQLAAVQEQTQTARLSDRNIVEIIDSLTKNYEFKLIYTVDGMEYLTSEHLERQIKEVVIDHGCINIVELPKILNIGIERIEPRVDSMCKKNSELMNMNGLLLTNNYIDDICEEINEDLQQRHNIPISDFAIKYSLPQDFLLNALTARIDTIVQGQIRNNTLQTKSYQNMIKSQLRGTMRACIRPISINQISSIMGIEESTINVLLEDLLRQDEIDGIIKQGTFISARFLKNQEHIIKKFYQENSYIEYDFLVKNLFIQKPKEMLTQIFKDDCLFLSTCCFSKTSLEHIKEQIVDTLNLEGAIDVTCLLPSILEQEEVETIINKHLGLEDCDLIETMIFRHSYLQKCTEAFKEKIIESMYKTPQKVIEKEEPKKKGGKGKKKGESENELFSKEEVMKHLRDNKLLASDYNPDEEDLLYKLLKERIQQYYNTIKVDLFEKKKNLSSDFINEVQMKLDERISTVAFIDKSIETVQAKSTTVDISSVKDKVCKFLRPILENMIFLYCKKYSIQIASSYLNKDSEESKETDLSDNRRLKLEEPYMFKSKEALVSVLETLPKDLQKLLKQFHTMIGEKKLHDACEFLQKNALDLGIKPINVDKKNEKNFIHAQRYFVKEDMRGVHHDPKLQFFYTLVLLGLEQNLFFGLNFDEKVVSIYCSILKDDPNVADEVKKDIQKAMHLFNETSEESVKEFEAINKHLKNFYKSS